jgi:hypothetical protein
MLFFIVSVESQGENEHPRFINNFFIKKRFFYFAESDRFQSLEMESVTWIDVCS